MGPMWCHTCVKPAERRLRLGSWMSISLWAQLRSPVTTTGLPNGPVCRSCKRNKMVMHNVVAVRAKSSCATALAQVQQQGRQMVLYAADMSAELRTRNVMCASTFTCMARVRAACNVCLIPLCQHLNPHTTMQLAHT